ncbi:MAG: pseudouridine synthase [Chthoniobacterales bacterium]
MRLNRFLAAAGVGSRRHCDQLIADGRVTINGRVVTDFSAQPAATDHVKVGSKMVRAEHRLHIILHKPAGFVSTRSDPNAHDTIFDLLPAHLPRLFNVGRLDAQSEGLLLLTNDGDLAQRLMHPRYKVEKEYEVTLDKAWEPELATKLLRGVMLDGQRARLDRIYPVKPTLVRVVLRQGINRQIRRMFYEIGYEVKRLVRTRVGKLRMGDLPRGHWRPLAAAELRSLEPELTRDATRLPRAKSRAAAGSRSRGS